MSLHHATSGELIDVRPLGEKLVHTASTALLRTAQLEVMRLILVAGKSISEHYVQGDITLQCLEGAVELRAHDKTQTLHAGEMVYLGANVPYALHAIENSALLMTVSRVYEHERQ